MEEKTARVLARLQHMKNLIYKTLKKTTCSSKSNLNNTCMQPITIHGNTLSLSETVSVIREKSDDTISSISIDSFDSGLSTMSEISNYSTPSTTLLFNRTSTQPNLHNLVFDPSVINYVSHNQFASFHCDQFLDDIEDHTISDNQLFHLPLAESSRRQHDDSYEDEDTLTPIHAADQSSTPLTSTFIDRWYQVTKSYNATFKDDLSVMQGETVQLLRSTHPHWIWVRNITGNEGFIPTDSL